MEGECSCSFYQRAKPYIAMISLQFGYAGMNIITKVSLNRGMSHYVLVVYRNAFATAVIAPFALLLERKIRPKMTLMMFLQIFVLGLLGPVIDQNLYYAGLKYTSPTFSCSMSNMLPAMIFVIAVLCRMEKVDMKKFRCQAKVLGTIVTVAGALLMTLYKGHIVNFLWSNHINASVPETTSGAYDKDWLKGSILLIFATLAWASFFILQAFTMRKYSAPLSLTALVCFMGTLQSTAVTFVMEHKTSVWTTGFDMNLLAAAYAGILSSSIAYYVQGQVMEKKGPVFVTAFSPLMMIIVAIMGTFILAEKFYIGGILGAVLIVAGLYSVLWGKYKEKEIEESIIFESMKGVITGHNQMMIISINDIELMQKHEEKRISTAPATVAISFPMPQPLMLAREAPKALDLN
ncbi:WAT1-related protein At5g07050-like [Lycium ferocissimum]|uniref:WAT1-related protein At5g07050-like n=1 Tax=Lycium ferocissimum TaxID=112874 RepID=UPI002815C188|nr:WAT1-related protein At5g07050-like [Lycium ferocissimum]